MTARGLQGALELLLRAAVRFWAEGTAGRPPAVGGDDYSRSAPSVLTAHGSPKDPDRHDWLIAVIGGSIRRRSPPRRGN